MSRAIVDSQSAPDFQLAGAWIWGDSAANGNVPEAGETIRLRKKFTLSDDVASAAGIVTCDNSFALFVNDRKLESGDDWSKPHAISLKGFLRAGMNEIIVVATNAGSGPNAAGLFFEARVSLADDTQLTVASDATWEWNPHGSKSDAETREAFSGNWKPVVVVPAIAAWTTTIEGNGKQLLLQSINGDVRMTRTSLLKSDFLMRSLGRPMREQIVSMRPSERDDSGSRRSDKWLDACRLSDAGSDRGLPSMEWRQIRPDQSSDSICPVPAAQPDEERTFWKTHSSPAPTAQEIEDVLWAIFMMPEFMLVR